MKTKAKASARATTGRTMSAAKFAELRKSVSQMVAIENGKVTPEAAGARVTVVEPPAAIRARLEMTQKEFAALLNVSIRTVQDWEIGRRKPDGPARSLLRVVAYAPETVLKALRSA
jgi:putative transcriptional regulator